MQYIGEGLPSDAAEEIYAKVTSRWEPLTEEAGLNLKLFDGGIELGVPGKDKGTAVQTILREMGDDAVTAYLGDDFTDEDAFSSINGKGLGILVRTEFRPTKAAVWLKPPRELLQFLDYWR